MRNQNINLIIQNTVEMFAIPLIVKVYISNEYFSI